MQFWLGALLELSEAEAILAAAPADGDMSVLSEAAQRYARGLATLRVRVREADRGDSRLGDKELVPARRNVIVSCMYVPEITMPAKFEK